VDHPALSRKDPDGALAERARHRTQLRWVGDHIDDARQPAAAKRFAPPIFIVSQPVSPSVRLAGFSRETQRRRLQSRRVQWHSPSSCRTRSSWSIPFSRPAILALADGLSVAFAGVEPGVGSWIYLRRFDQLDAV
jgi:hypothetical protein